MSTRKKIIKDFFNSSEMNREKWLKKGKTFHDEDIRFLDGPKSEIKEDDTVSIIPAIAGG